MTITEGGQGMREVIRIDEARNRDHLGVIMRGAVEETLNAMLDAEADRLCGGQPGMSAAKHGKTLGWAAMSVPCTPTPAK